MQNSNFDFITVYGLFLSHLSRYRKVLIVFAILGIILSFYKVFNNPTIRTGEFIIRIGDQSDLNISDMVLVTNHHTLVHGIDEALFSSQADYEQLLNDLSSFQSIEVSTLNRSNFKVIVSFVDSSSFNESPEEVVLNAFRYNKVINEYIHDQVVIIDREITLINDAIERRSNLDVTSDVGDADASDYLVSRFALSDMGSLSQLRLNFEMMKTRLNSFSVLSKIDYQSTKVILIRYFLLNFIMVVFLGLIATFFLAVHNSYRTRKAKN